VPSDLPHTVAGFIEASNARDLDGSVACFADDAVVEDEGQTHTGIDQVREWKRETERRFTYTIEPINVEQRDGQAILTATLAGDFPGSPVDLVYEFTIADGAIKALRIHP
jgi:ketosteroid isomerase-like protein